MNEAQIEKEINELCKHLSDTLIKKNHDYGDSVYKQFKRFGDLSMLMRLTDKTLRIETLIEKEGRVEESLMDTYLDIAGYAIMGIINHTREGEKTTCESKPTGLTHIYMES